MNTALTHAPSVLSIWASSCLVLLLVKSMYDKVFMWRICGFRHRRNEMLKIKIQTSKDQTEIESRLAFLWTYYTSVACWRFSACRPFGLMITSKSQNNKHMTECTYTIPVCNCMSSLPCLSTFPPLLSNTYRPLYKAVCIDYYLVRETLPVTKGRSSSSFSNT